MASFANRNSMTQLIKEPTRVAGNSRTLLDHIYYGNSCDVLNWGVIKYGTSDHDVTFIIMKRNLPKKKKESFACRNLKDFIIDRLKNNLKSVD